MEKCRAYEIYKQTVGGVTFDGKPMLEYDELPSHIKKAWDNVNKKEIFYKCDFCNKYIDSVEISTIQKYSCTKLICCDKCISKIKK
jgi:hypothetical protein